MLLCWKRRLPMLNRCRRLSTCFGTYTKAVAAKRRFAPRSDYRESGELEGTLANHAESAFLALDGDAQAALKPIVRQLVSPGPELKLYFKKPSESHESRRPFQ
jgi:hypothetical protein